MRKDDGLPTNICHRCLYNIELFSEFRDGVHQCERKLQDFVLSLASRTPTAWHLDDILNEQHESSDIQQNSVVVIDPLKCYESSDNEIDEGEMSDIQPHDQTNIQPVFVPSQVSDNSQSFSSPSPTKPINKFMDTKPLRNVNFCQYCEAAFAERHDCEAHESSKHNPLTPYACNFCPFLCDNQSDHIGHIKQNHDAERPYFCTQCNKNFGRRADLRKHAVSHTGIRPFSCPICGKTFSRKTNVTTHMKVHEGKKSKDSTGHQRTPTKLKNAFAPTSQANMGFAAMMPTDDFQPTYPPHSNQSYQIQQYSPTNLENAVYSKCTVKSTEPNTIPKLKLKLKKPIQAITPRFDCSVCQKSFKLKRDLDRHSHVHIGMKFQCSVCQKGFARRDKLVRHEKTHANRSKTAALPESAFFVENLKRGSHLTVDHRPSPAATVSIDKQPFTSDTFRPQFYAEYDLSETNH